MFEFVTFSIEVLSELEEFSTPQAPTRFKSIRDIIKVLYIINLSDYFLTRSVRLLHSFNASLESSPSQRIITLLKII
ncbi:MAG TPA: hypothetical protein QF601_03600 [Dehalococcoidia bacterium]|nr:hypothetical protein [Dehalococcoidia bacterium]